MGIFRTSEETAVILSIMMNRANATRIRISDKTIKFISGRTQLKAGFRVNLDIDISEFGFKIIELSTGGQAIIKISALESAKLLTPIKVFSEKELKELKKGTWDIDFFRNELENDEDGEEDDN